MYILDSVEIKGFWGAHKVSTRLFDNYNFIIGANGSGKTTTLNLVAGVIRADKEILSRLDFDSVKLGLKDPKSRKRPSIEVVRNREAPFFHVEYKIFESAAEKPFTYSLSEIEAERYLSSQILRARLAGKEIAGRSLKKHLEEMVSLTWLSVHRASWLEGDGDGDDPLDSRLEDFSNRLVRYLSALGKQVNRLYEKFQEEVFLSLLTSEDAKFAILPKKRDLQAEKKALNQIFSQFHIDKTSYSEKIEKHFLLLEGARDKIGQAELSNPELMAFFDLFRIEKTVKFWDSVTEEKGRLLASREKFLELLNDLMQRKKLFINERNEIIIQTQSGKSLTPHQLSSGEKQMLIILGEALLQEGKTFVYMADEPEISLHVDWQESLASNIKALNPAAQIVFATHSPDVVGMHQDYLVHMDECIA